MAKDVNKKFTINLDISTEDAEKQVKAAADNIKKTLLNASNVADKMTVLKDVVGYIGQIDKTLAALQAKNGGALGHIFDGIDADLKKSLENIFGVTGESLSALEQLKTKVASLNASNVTGDDLKPLEKEVKDLYKSLGMLDMAGISGKGKIETRIKNLTASLENFGLVFGGVQDKIKNGLNIGTTGAVGGSNGVQAQTDTLQEQIDTLQEQIDKYKQLQDELKNLSDEKAKFDNGKDLSSSFTTNKDAKSVKTLLTLWKSLNDERKQMLADGATSSPEYFKNLAKLVDVSLKIQEIDANWSKAEIDSLANVKVGKDGTLKSTLFDMVDKSSDFLADATVELNNIPQTLGAIVAETESKMTELQNAMKPKSASQAASQDGMADTVQDNVNETVAALEAGKKKIVEAFKSYYKAAVEAKKDGYKVQDGMVSYEMDQIGNSIEDMLNKWGAKTTSGLGAYDELTYIYDMIADGFAGTENFGIDDIEGMVNDIFASKGITINVPVEAIIPNTEAVDNVGDKAQESVDDIASGMNKAEGEVKDVTSAFQDLINYITQSGISPKTFFQALESGAITLDNELKKILKSLDLIDDAGKIKISATHSGSNNAGGMISDKYALIARPIGPGGEKLKFAQQAQPKLLEAEKMGASVGTIIHVFEDKMNGIIYELQKTVSGTTLAGQDHKIISKDFLSASEDQIKKMLYGFVALQKNGLWVDQNSKNILYDKDKGFSFIDLFSAAIPGITASASNTLEENVNMFLDHLFVNNHSIMASDIGQKFINKVYDLMNEVLNEISGASVSPAGVMNNVASGADSATDDVNNVVKAFQNLSHYIATSTNGPKDFFNKLSSGAIQADGELKNILTTLSMIDENGDVSFKPALGGLSNKGTLISDDYVLISRETGYNDEKLGFSQDIMPRTIAAKNAGANIGAILDVYQDEFNKNVFYELQSVVSGKSILAHGGGKINTDFLSATDEQIKKLISDLMILKDNDLWVDWNGNNILYDKDKGFSLIDFFAASVPGLTVGKNNSVKENLDMFFKMAMGQSGGDVLQNNPFMQHVYDLADQVIQEAQQVKTPGDQSGAAQHAQNAKAIQQEADAQNQLNAAKAAAVNTDVFTSSINDESAAHEENTVDINAENAALQANIELKKKAQSMTWGEFAMDDSLSGLKQASGMQSLSELHKFWKQANYDKQIDFHEIGSKAEVEQTIMDLIGPSGKKLAWSWYSTNSDFTKKTDIEDMILSNDELRNAAMNYLYHIVGSNLPFKEWIDTAIEMFRGDNQPNIFGPEQALSFGVGKATYGSYQHVESAQIKPIHTLGNINVPAITSYGLDELETFVPSEYLPVADDSWYVKPDSISFEDYYAQLNNKLKQALNKHLFALEKQRVKGLLKESLGKDFMDDLPIALNLLPDVFDQFVQGIVPDQLAITATDSISEHFVDAYNAMSDVQKRMVAYYASLQTSHQFDGAGTMFDELSKSGFTNVLMHDKAGVQKHVDQLTGESKFNIFGAQSKMTQQTAHAVQQETQAHQQNTQAIQQEADAQQKLNALKQQASDIKDILWDAVIDSSGPESDTLNKLWHAIYDIDKTDQSEIKNGYYMDQQTGEIKDPKEIFDLAEFVEDVYGESMTDVKDYLKQVYSNINFNKKPDDIDFDYITDSLDNLVDESYMSSLATKGVAIENIADSIANIKEASKSDLAQGVYDGLDGNKASVTELFQTIEQIEQQYGENLDYVKDCLKQVYKNIDFDDIQNLPKSDDMSGFDNIKKLLTDAADKADADGDGIKYMGLQALASQLENVSKTDASHIANGDYVLSNTGDVLPVTGILNLIKSIEDHYNENLEYVKDYLKQVYTDIEFDAPANADTLDFSSVKDKLHDAAVDAYGVKDPDKYLDLMNLINELTDVNSTDADALSKGVYYEDGDEFGDELQIHDLLTLVEDIETKHGENLEFVKNYLKNVANDIEPPEATFDDLLLDDDDDDNHPDSDGLDEWEDNWSQQNANKPKYTVSDYELAYMAESAESQAAIDDLALFNQRYEELYALTQTKPIDITFPELPTPSEVKEVVAAFNAYKDKQSELSILLKYPKEGNEEKIQQLQAEVIGLQNQLRGAALGDGVDASEYESKYGLNKIDAARLKNLVDTPYNINNLIENLELDYEQKMKALSDGMKDMINDGDDDVIQQFLSQHAQQLKSNIVADTISDQTDDSSAALQQQLQAEKAITAEKEQQAAIDDQKESQTVAYVAQTQDIQTETTAMNELLLKIQAVEQAVRAKTAAFEAEGVAVEETVNKEIAALTQLKALLDNIQSALQVVFASNNYNLGDINASQDKTSSNSLPNILQTIQSTLEQIYGVLKGFTGIEADNKNSVNYKEPVVDNNVVDSDAYKLLASKIPEDVSTETTLSAIKGAVDQLAKQSSGDEKSGEKSLDQLVASLLAATTELKNVANGIVQHQKAAKSDTSVANARISNKDSYAQIRDVALNSLGDKALESEVTEMKALANGVVQVTGWLKVAEDAWEGFTVQINEANEASKLAFSTNSKAAKQAAAQAKTMQQSAGDDDDANVKLYDRAETEARAKAKIAKYTSEGKIATVQFKDSGRYTITTLEKIGGLTKQVFQTFDENDEMIERTTATMSNTALAKVQELQKVAQYGLSNGLIGDGDKLYQAFAKASQELDIMTGAYSQADQLSDDQIEKWKLQIDLVAKLGKDIQKLVAARQNPVLNEMFAAKKQKQSAAFNTDYAKLRETIAIPDSFTQRIKDAGDAIKNAVNNNELQVAQNNWAALRKEIELTAMQQGLYIKKSVASGGMKKNAYGATPVINAQAKFNALSPRAQTYINDYDSGIVSDAYGKYEASFKRLIALQNQLQNAPSISDAQKAQFTELKNECNEYYKELKKIIDASEKFASDADNNIRVMGDIDVNDSHSRGNALKEYVQEVYGAKATIQGFNGDMTQLKFTLKNTDGTITQMTAAFDAAKTQMGSLRGETKKTTGVLELFAGKTKELWTYMAARMGVDELIQAIRTGIQYVREIDSALTELKKVTDETDASYDRFLQNMSKTASAIGSTVSELTTMAAEWARLGYSMEESAQLAESTAVLLNVSEFSDATAASEALISTMQAFGYAADESMHVVDILNEVGNNFAISSDGLATALQDSASSLMEAGNTLEQSVALIAAANKVVQDPDSVGSALRTISLRLRGTSVSVLEELGEETDGAVESVSKLQEKVQALSGVNILDATGSYKDTYTILKEIGTVWEDMSDIDQAKCCLCVQKCA